MALEMANTINQLVESNPLGTDLKSQGDDHIRLIKKTLRNTFPNITGPITVSEAAINGLGTGKNLTFPGMIVMWSGATVPSGWLLCDGTGKLSNGQAVPDLRGKFILGAGQGVYIGDTGGSANSVVVAHSHTAVAETDGSHSHSSDFNNQAGVDGDYWGQGGRYQPKEAETNSRTGTGGAHGHSVTVASAGVSGVGANLPPYYALAFIIKE